ncbi:Mitogen-activated protein kinase kinase kinase 18 [Camellia lanceoleosa]|uniref:Mitogen-activated protein kinase kinase kinase 18 n=1 Tax=Camellia lanceoleosa TaxID=1840588 RepID=A0ACC0FPR8_9ERIC|nr:Mitogen-activated protein kinase kinase kinase 18 [Camellia lanceoleosa]
MATRPHPWLKVNDPASALYRIRFSGEVSELPTWFSEKAKDFLGKYLRRDSKERWTAKELLCHPFLNDLESNSPKVDEEFTQNSPTTVLDQDVWDSVEVLEAHWNLTHIGSSSNFQAKRIRNLIGDSSNLPNWSWEEDWINVKARRTLKKL